MAEVLFTNDLGLLYNQNQNIRFGTIGEKLKPYNSDNSNNFIQKILSMFKDKENTFTKQTYEFESRGLLILKENNGGNAVFSFHDPI